MRKRKSVKAILERKARRIFDHKDEIMIGKIVGAYGIKGEVKVKPESDIFDRQIKVLDSVLVYIGTTRETLNIESFRFYKDMFLIKFKEITNRTDAESIVGGEIWIRKEQQVPLEEGEYYFSDLVGCEVKTESGRTIGTVSSVLEQPASYILEVKGKNGKEILVPFIDEFVKEVDVKGKKIVVKLIEGME